MLYTSELGEPATPTLWTDDAESILLVDGEELVRDFHVPSWGAAPVLSAAEALTNGNQRGYRPQFRNHLPA